MSARSSLPRLCILAALVTTGACGSKAPEADPAKLEAKLKLLVSKEPPLGASIRRCEEKDYENPAITVPTARTIAKMDIPDIPEMANWINPPEIDAPAFRTVMESKDERARRRATALLLGAKGYMLYRVDLVNVPMALGLKELKRGAVGARVIGYDQNLNIVCVRDFLFQNDKAVSEEAMRTSTKPTIDPAVMKRLREDLAEQMKDKISQLMGGG